MTASLIAAARVSRPDIRRLRDGMGLHNGILGDLVLCVGAVDSSALLSWATRTSTRARLPCQPRFSNVQNQSQLRVESASP